MILHLLGIVFGILVFGKSIAFGGQDMMDFTVEPAYETFMKCEPIQLIMSFQNHGEKIVTIELGAAGIENIRVIINGDNYVKKVMRGKIPGGIVSKIIVNIEPGKTSKRILFFDDFLSINKEGEYKIEIQIGKEKSLISKTTTIHIIPDNENRIEQRLKELWEKYNKLSIYSEERTIIEKILCLTKHEIAMKYQMEIITHDSNVPFENLNAAIQSLVQTRKPAVYKLLVENIVEKKDKNPLLRLAVFYHLSVLGIENLDQVSYKIIEPYKDEILKAAPVSISD